MADTEPRLDAPPFVDKTLIAPIELDDAHGKWLFEPKADITPLEAVLIAHMWAAIAIRHLHGKHNRWDWREYLGRDYGIVDWTTLTPVDQNTLTPTKVRVDLARHFRVLEGT